MMKAFEADGLYLGEAFESPRHFAIFGSANLRKEQLSERFPQFKFSFLKQVHGRAVVTANSSAITEADGQFTREKGIALVIQTADCVPILMGSQNEICALHAGWRGVATNIVKAAAEQIKSPPDWIAFGPHIQFGSFEVGRDVVDQLLKAAPRGEATEPWVRPHHDPNKSFFNLEGLLRAQFRALYPKTPIWCSPHNTLTDRRYHSYRRDKPDQGRQYSFVVLK